jgi:TRAP transporter TAXI family solute receptor
MKKETKKAFWIGMVAFMFSCQVYVFAGGQKEDDSGNELNKPVHLSFSAQGLGTTMNTQANAFSTIFLPVLPSGSSVDVATNSPGGLSSPFAIEEGLADLTIAGAASSYWVSHEPGLLGRPVTKKFRIIAGGLTEQLIIIVMTQDFIKNSGCSTLEDVIAKKSPISLVAKQPGSMGYKAAEAVLAEYKLTFKDIESWGGKVTLTDSSNIVDMMKDSKADLCIDHTSSSQANWTELAMTTPITMAVPAEKVLAGLRAQGFSNTILPKGSYNNLVKADLHTVGSNDTLACSSDLNDELVYLLTKTTCENKEKLVSIFSTFKVFDPQTAWDPSKCGAPLHPGAERYYREKGWMK